MFTTGSSTILTAGGDHLFAIVQFPLATCFESRHCEDYSKEAKWTKSGGDMSARWSHMDAFLPQRLSSDRKLHPTLLK